MDAFSRTSTLLAKTLLLLFVLITVATSLMKPPLTSSNENWVAPTKPQFC